MSFSKKMLKAAAVFLLFSLCFLGGRTVSWLLSTQEEAAASSSLLFSSENWGLSYPEEGRLPTGNASIEELAAHHAYYAENTEEKVLYLTFDCGYENGFTAAILDTLKEKKVPAAFFVTGDFLDAAPDMIKRMTKEGHIVGNHTEHHPDMSAISSLSAFQQELSAVEASYAKITGESLPAYYRPPQGKYSPENLKQADELGYATIFWSLAYVDWNQDDQPTKEEAFEKLLGRIHPGAVVLLHSTSEANASYLGELLDQWKALGYRFGTLDELTGQDLSSDDPKADPGGSADV